MIRSAENSVKLLKVIKNPITDHLPVGCKKICTSFNATKLTHPREIVPKTEEPIVVVVGAIAKGKVKEIDVPNCGVGYFFLLTCFSRNISFTQANPCFFVER